MSVEVAGHPGNGATTVYSMPDGYDAVLETISFTVVTGGGGAGHQVRLTLLSPTGDAIARLDDLNVGAAGQENFYTYGLGLNGSACILPAGLAVTDALPWTELLGGSSIVVTPIDSLGNTISDAISGVLLHFDRPPVTADVPQTDLPITLLPGLETG